MKKLLLILSILGLYQPIHSAAVFNSFKSKAAVATTALMYGAYRYNKSKTEPSAEQKYVFTQLKEHMGIKEKIPFSLAKRDFIGGKACYRSIYISFFKGDKKILWSNRVYLEEDAENDIFTIFALAHELEHHRQKYKYPGSYHGSDSRLKENGADEIAIKMITCPDCVQKIKEHRSEECRLLGYWGPKEFDDYTDILLRQGYDRNSGVILDCERKFYQTK